MPREISKTVSTITNDLLKPVQESEKLAFVLSGGASLGSLQVGCLEALLQHGIFPDLIVGTSVGALNGAFLAKDPTLEGITKLKEIWLSLQPHGPFQEGGMRVLMRLLLGRKYLYANDTLRQLVCQYIGDISFEELQVPTVMVATDMESGEPLFLDQGPVDLAVLASSAIPGIFPSVQIDSKEYVDGGVMSNCGLETAWDHGARRMVVIATPLPPPGRGVGVLKPLGRALQVALDRLCQLEVAWFSNRCPVVVLDPVVPLEGHTFKDFTKTPFLLESGKTWTEAFLRSDKGVLLKSFSRQAVHKESLRSNCRASRLTTPWSHPKESI